MDIRARDTDRELLLEFSGEMDHHGARNALKEVEIAIDAALPRSLILDFDISCLILQRQSLWTAPGSP